MMLRSTRTVSLHAVEFTAVAVLVLTRLHVVVTACPDSDHDSSVQSCVEDLRLDAESWRTIEALRSHYDDFPTHCRYG